MSGVKSRQKSQSGLLEGELNNIEFSHLINFSEVYKRPS
jgi:hypothetical protein